MDNPDEIVDAGFLNGEYVCASIAGGVSQEEGSVRGVVEQVGCHFAEREVIEYTQAHTC